MTRRIVPEHLPPPTVLLVDDDPVPRETLASLLTQEGFKVTEAASAEEAESLLYRAKPSFELVITDLVMPGRSGMDVLQTALSVNPSCDVLILTGFGSVREATEAMDHGAFDFITKPMNLDQFRNTLRRLMEHQQLLHERDALRAKVQELQGKLDRMEATVGRMEMLAGRITPAGPVAPEGAQLGDLERLGSLRSRGLLTEEEFESAKKSLLARWLS
jgi:DNA-binding NtrC family response regulator